MKRRTYTISQFLCPECQNVIPLPRKANRSRENGHIKDLYCPYCNKVQKTIEYKDGQAIRNMDGEEV
jgi:hypothetical protein